MRWESQNPVSVGRALAWVGENTAAIAFLFFYLMYLCLILLTNLIVVFFTFFYIMVSLSNFLSLYFFVLNQIVLREKYI